MLSTSLRATNQVAFGLKSLPAPCILSRMTCSTKLSHHIPRLGKSCTVRSLHIHRVIVGSRDQTFRLRNAVKLPSRSPDQRDLRGQTDFSDPDIETWLSKVPRPPDNYWEIWTPALDSYDKGGFSTAMKFLIRWKEVVTTTFITTRYKGRTIVQCTGCFQMPMIGDRTVVAYGYTKKEATYNLYPVLLSKLYESGELDTVYLGTIASRKLVGIYEQAAQYGVLPRFEVSVLEDQPGARFQITLAVPEWKVHALASAPTYIEALATTVETYQNQVNGRDVKKQLTPKATKSSLELIRSGTAYHALHYLLKKLDIIKCGKRYLKLVTEGPRIVYQIFIRGKLYSSDVPMIRDCDAVEIGNLTAIVQVLQEFGFDTIDGFKEEYEANSIRKAERMISHKDQNIGGDFPSPEISPEQPGLDQPAHDVQTMNDQPTHDVQARNETTMADLLDKFNKALEDDAAEGVSEAQAETDEKATIKNEHKQ